MVAYLICCYSVAPLSVGFLACDLPLLSHSESQKSKPNKQGKFGDFTGVENNVENVVKNTTKQGWSELKSGRFCSVFVRFCSVFKWSFSGDKGWRGVAW